MDKLKKKLATLGVFIVLLTGYCAKQPTYHANYELLENEKAYARCSCGDIYIGDAEFLKSIPDGEGIILVEDQRNSLKDPNMKIYRSCNICTREDRNNILEVLQEYERENPTPWDRSIESMRLEWLMHNLSYQFSYEQNRTEDVDLNNNDEEKYHQKLLQLLFHV